MTAYYTTIIALSLFSLGILCILVQENGRIRAERKRLYYLTFLLIAAAAVAEWVGVMLSGAEGVSQTVLRLVKCADYILTPLTGGALIRQIATHKKVHLLLTAVLGINALFQIVSVFTGWMVAFDAQNNYVHGPLYGVYVTTYLVVLGVLIVESFLYGRSFQRQNRASLYAIMGLVVIAIAMQELLGSQVRTAYIGLTIGSALLFIHNSEFSQLRADAHISRQQEQLMTDALTGLLSRYAYSKALRDFDDEGPGAIPEDLAVFAMDINGLKTANDTLGHEAGDELICGAARCIESVLGPYGWCCRTGGDEFVSLLHMSRRQAAQALLSLRQEAAAWHGQQIDKLSLAAGYVLAADHPDANAQELARLADQAMYDDKAAFYEQAGNDRRADRHTPHFD